MLLFARDKLDLKKKPPSFKRRPRITKNLINAAAFNRTNTVLSEEFFCATKMTGLIFRRDYVPETLRHTGHIIVKKAFKNKFSPSLCVIVIDNKNVSLITLRDSPQLGVTQHLSGSKTTGEILRLNSSVTQSMMRMIR